MIARLFWQIWVILVDLCYVALFEDFTIRMIKSVKVFAFSFRKLIAKKKLIHKNRAPGKILRNATPPWPFWTLTLVV